MTKIIIDLPEQIDKFLSIKKITDGAKSKEDVIIDILEEKYKLNRKMYENLMKNSKEI